MAFPTYFFMISASCRKASGSIEPAFSVFTATSTRPCHVPGKIEQQNEPKVAILHAWISLDSFRLVVVMVLIF